MPASVLLCRPDHFRVEYQINPWMEIGQVDFAKAWEQWQNLKATYQNLGVKVYEIPQRPEWPDMVFAADQGLRLDSNRILLSRFRYPERRGETQRYQDWLAQQGFTCLHLPEDVFLEGYGEVLPVTSKKICIGHGFRNSSNLTQLLRKNYGIESISVELIDSRYYHLDTCLCVLDSDTAFYYPYAFSRSSRQILENEFAKLYELSQEEAKNFAANSVIVGEKIVMQKNNPQLEKQLCRWGYIPLGLDISEFMKAGGGVHCLTLPLD